MLILRNVRFQKISDFFFALSMFCSHHNIAENTAKVGVKHQSINQSINVYAKEI
jgi:hypothetical protein